MRLRHEGPRARTGSLVPRLKLAIPAAETGRFRTGAVRCLRQLSWFLGHRSGASRARAEHLIRLKEEVEAQVARYPGRVTFARIPRERNGAADELAKDGARASKALSADRGR
jgi:hypothetical protein